MEEEEREVADMLVGKIKNNENDVTNLITPSSS